MSISMNFIKIVILHACSLTNKQIQIQDTRYINWEVQSRIRFNYKTVDYLRRIKILLIHVKLRSVLLGDAQSLVNVIKRVSQKTFKFPELYFLFNRRKNQRAGFLTEE